MNRPRVETTRIIVAWRTAKHGWSRAHVLDRVARGPGHESTTVCGAVVPDGAVYGAYIAPEAKRCGLCVRMLWGQVKRGHCAGKA